MCHCVYCLYLVSQGCHTFFGSKKGTVQTIPLRRSFFHAAHSSCAEICAATSHECGNYGPGSWMIFEDKGHLNTATCKVDALVISTFKAFVAKVPRMKSQQLLDLNTKPRGWVKLTCHGEVLYFTSAQLGIWPKAAKTANKACPESPLSKVWYLKWK